MREQVACERFARSALLVPHARYKVRVVGLQRRLAIAPIPAARGPSSPLTPSALLVPHARYKVRVVGLQRRLAFAPIPAARGPSCPLTPSPSLYRMRDIRFELSASNVDSRLLRSPLRGAPRRR